MSIVLLPAAARRVLARIGAAVLCTLLVWLLVSANLFLYPQTAKEPASADAIVVLAGAAAERLPVGQQLLRDGYAPVLVLSTTDTPGNANTDFVCEYTTNPAIECFTPAPLSTRAEARSIARLAADNGWDEIIVVTSKYHVVRAEANISQCSTAHTIMVASEPSMSPWRWAGRFVEETGGLLAAFLRPACGTAV
ncbi:YdcF family protein [Arthrobacter luteolus]|uniref:YdcF family protein n=1 Tax=Arthrobacter luteolus TaxID=98672 RepID=UPI00083594E2|nr:YdcF family protein [Arthrobacter luteolus]